MTCFYFVRPDGEITYAYFDNNGQFDYDIYQTHSSFCMPDETGCYFSKDSDGKYIIKRDSDDKIISADDKYIYGIDVHNLNTKEG